MVRANALTFFNVVLAAMILALLATGGFRDGLFVGGVVVANVAAATPTSPQLSITTMFSPIFTILATAMATRLGSGRPDPSR